MKGHIQGKFLYANFTKVHKVPELPRFLLQVSFPFQEKQADQGDVVLFSMHHQSASQFHLSLVLEPETR